MQEEKKGQRPIDRAVSSSFDTMRENFSFISKGRAKYLKWTGVGLFLIGFLSGIVYVANPTGFVHGLEYISSFAKNVETEKITTGRYPTATAKFTSPRSGTYAASEPMTISWTGLRNAKVGLILYKGNGNCTFNRHSSQTICGTPFYSATNYIGVVSTANNIGAYYWKIPTDLVGSDFRITGVSMSDPKFVFQSQAFSIIQRSSFLSPTPGQQVTAGGKLSITWKSTKGRTFDLYLYKGNHNCQNNRLTGSFVCGSPFYSKNLPIARGVINSYIWAVPKSLQGSDFHITAVDTKDPNMVLQSGAFSINSTAPKPPRVAPVKPMY
jgi:hypothetical protein